LSKHPDPQHDSSGQAGALAEAARLRQIAAIRALLPFLTARETGDAEYDEAPYPEQRAMRVLRLLGATENVALTGIDDVDCELGEK
jgi:hypothetical protein